MVASEVAASVAEQATLMVAIVRSRSPFLHDANRLHLKHGCIGGDDTSGNLVDGT